MATWSENELTAINSVDELRISTRRPDGSLRKPVIIWAVRVGDDLYIRALQGVSGLWYRHATEVGSGSISAGGVERNTNFIPEHDEQINAQIDAAYQEKYSGYAKYIVDSTLTENAREATLRVSPQ